MVAKGETACPICDRITINNAYRVISIEFIHCLFGLARFGGGDRPARP